MTAKPIGALEFHYAMIQFLIMSNTFVFIVEDKRRTTVYVKHYIYLFCWYVRSVLFFQRSGSIFVSLCNNIQAGKAKWKQSLIQTFYETSSAHFLDWLTFAESANQNYFRCLFF